MARKKPEEPWYFDYLRSRVREIFRWSPERKKALKRAQISKNPDLWNCEECGKGPLTRKDKQVDHIIPCENVQGWDGWSAFINRAIEVPAELISITCRPCHNKKSAQENRDRDANRAGRPNNDGQNKDSKKAK